MGKYIDTQFITGGATQPVKKGTLDLMQEAHQEAEIDISQMLIAQGDTEAFPTSLSPRIMYGCRWLSGTGAVSQGAIMYGSKIYRTPGAVGIVLGFGQVVVGTIVNNPTISTDADPVTFGGTGGSHNVHIDSVIEWSAGTSGSGDFDLNDCLLYGQWGSITYNAGYLSAATGTWTLSSGSDFDIRWRQEGRTAWFSFNIISGTLSSATNYVIIDIPLNTDFKHAAKTIQLYTDSGTTLEHCICEAIAGTSQLKFYKPTGSFASGSGFAVYGQIVLELEKADF